MVEREDNPDIIEAQVFGSAEVSREKEFQQKKEPSKKV
jgi:hypothetical protein